jgi:hypothetical protein
MNRRRSEAFMQMLIDFRRNLPPQEASAWPYQQVDSNILQVRVCECVIDVSCSPRAKGLGW